MQKDCFVYRSSKWAQDSSVQAIEKDSLQDFAASEAAYLKKQSIIDFEMDLSDESSLAL
jgi:hypothetical protein